MSNRQVIASLHRRESSKQSAAGCASACKRWLCLNTYIRSRLYIAETRFQLRHQWQQSGQVIRLRIKHDDCQRQRGKALLVRKIFVYSNKDVEACSRQSQKVTVLYARPPHLNDRSNRMTREVAPKPGWNRLVKQKAHRQTDVPAPVQAPLQPFLETRKGSPPRSLQATKPPRRSRIDFERGHGYP